MNNLNESTMNWKFLKKYLSFEFEKYGYKSHVQLPTFHDGWLYFGIRNNENISHIARIKNDNFETFLSPNFDFDNKGIMPSSFCEDAFFYTGYVENKKSHYTQNICVLIGGSRYCALTAEQDESFLVNSAFVMNDNSIYKMWYVSGYDWVGKKPLYRINYAESKNKINWDIVKKDVVPKLDSFESPSRPFVLKVEEKYEMYFSSMNLNSKSNYKLQYAESDDTLNWRREKISIATEDDMLCYPFILNRNFMFINGSNYGEKTILLYERE